MRTNRVLLEFAVPALLLIVLGASVPSDAAAQEALSGILGSHHVDYDPDTGIAPIVEYYLLDPEGGSTTISFEDRSILEPYGGIQPLLGEIVHVLVEADGERRIVTRLDMTPDPDKRHPSPVSGSLPQVTLLLRYSDDSSTPRTREYFEFMYTSDAFPGTNHYLKEASYGIADIDGSQVFGWYTLPQTYGYYNWDKDGNGDIIFDVSRALPHAVALADADVYFPAYRTVNFVLNGHIECPKTGTSCAWAQSSVAISADSGVPLVYGFTIMGFWGHDRMAVVPHETLHTWGLDHSGSYIGWPYDSNWDVMSGQGLNWDPTYGHLTVYGISYHMLGMGWIPLNRNWDTGDVGAGMVEIERLEFPPLTPGTHAMSTLRFGGATAYYTVEYRTLTGWDGSGGIPGRAVLLHQVDVLRSDQQARVVDVDGDGDPNDAHAIWEPTETFTNDLVDVIMHVERWTDEVATVSVSNHALPEVHVAAGAAFPGYGTIAQPWDTVIEGYASVHRGGLVHIAPGVYPEAMRIGKRCRLVRSGSSGVVRIGN